MVECLSKEASCWLVLRQCSCPSTLVGDNDGGEGERREREERMSVAGTCSWLLGRYWADRGTGGSDNLSVWSFKSPNWLQNVMSTALCIWRERGGGRILFHDIFYRLYASRYPLCVYAAYLEWLKLEDGEAVVIGVARRGHGCWVSGRRDWWAKNGMSTTRTARCFKPSLWL